jgi:tetratricopeptide (TPR) repeat protein
MRTVVFPLVLCVAAQTGHAAGENFTYLGTNPELAAGAQALERGRFAEGIELTLAGLRAEVSADNRASALNNLCAGYTGLAQYDIAIVHCSEALQLDPGSWHAYNNRAIAYLGKGQLRLARRDVRAGLAINPLSDKLRQVSDMVERASSRPRSRRDAPDPLT